MPCIPAHCPIARNETSALAGFVISAIHFLAHYREITLRHGKLIGLECEVDGRHPHARFQFRDRLKALKSILPHRVFVFDRLVSGGKDEFEVEKGRGGFRILCWPTRLVDDRHIGHLQCGDFPIRTEREPADGYRSDPIKTFGRDRRMEIMKLVCRNSLSLEYSQSGVRKYALMRLSRSPVFARHVAVVRRRCSPRLTIALIVGPTAVKAAAARQLSLEVIDV